MGVQREVRALLHLAIPLTCVQLAEGMISFIDTLMMGWLGTAALAAGGLGGIIFWTLLSLFTGLLEMTGALAAEAFGAEDRGQVRRINAQALWLSLAVSIPALLLLWHLAPILLRLGQAPSIVTQTMAYLRGMMWGLPAALGIFVFKEITTALMRPQLLTALMLISIPLNVILNDALMFGRWGLPELGLAGIGWSSAIAFWTLFIVSTLALKFHPDWRRWQLFAGISQPDWPTLREIVQLGWPLCVDYGTEFGALTAAALLMGLWGTDWLAAHRVVMTTTELLLMVSWGLSYATAMRTAHAIGAGQPNIAQQVMILSLILNGGLISLLALPLWTLPEVIVGLYVDPHLPENQGAVLAAIALFPIGVIFQICQGFRLMSLGTLQGLRDTPFLATVDFIAHWLIGIGGGFVLGQLLGLTGLGLWWGLALGQLAAAVLLSYRVRHLLQRRVQAYSKSLSS